ncbi:MAG: hypothetical protein C5B51_21320 [Terriglobia bacterium]|nr:MAG: hypothetical protein C5B51_21320 [Terriglobia bacterium]
MDHACGERVRQEAIRTGIAFIATEIETGLVFAALGLNTDGPRRKRCTTQALKAYRAVLRLSGTSAWRGAEAELNTKLTELKAKLLELGEVG